jgi:hypothetical protein
MKEYLLISRHWTEELELTRADSDLIAAVLVRRLARYSNGRHRKPLKGGLVVQIPDTGLSFAFLHEIKGMLLEEMRRVRTAGGDTKEFLRREVTR